MVHAELLTDPPNFSSRFPAGRVQQPALPAELLLVPQDRLLELGEDLRRGGGQSLADELLQELS